MKNKYIRYTLRLLGGLVLLLLLLYIGLSLYVSANKQSLLKQATTELGTLTGGTVAIADLSVSLFNNFPYLAIGLTKIDIRDSLYARHGHRFFYAEKLFVRLNPVKLLLTKISINKLEIDSAGLYLYTDSSGYSNTYLLKGKAKPATTEKQKNPQNPFEKILAKRMKVTVEDLSKAKLFDLYVHTLDVKTKSSGDGLDFFVKESILVKNLAFNLTIGSYLAGHTLEGSYTLHYSGAKKELRFDSIPISISQKPLRLSGVFSFGEVQQFALRVNAAALPVDFGKSLLTKKTAKGISLVSVKSPVDVSASLNGSLRGGNPLIVAKWVTQNNSIATPLLDFSNCSFSGMYTNEVVAGLPRNDSNSKVEVYKFRGDWRGLSMSSARIIINNLTTPVVNTDLHSEFSLSQLNTVLETAALSLTGGTGIMDLNYNGPVTHITPQNASLNGLLRIRNGTMVMSPSQATLSNCNARIRFVNADILIDSLGCKIRNETIHVRGEARNALALVGDSPGNISLALDISAPVLNIDHLTSILYRKLPARKKSTDPKTGSLAKTAQKIDNLLSSGNVAVTLSAPTLIFHRFRAKNASASIAIDENSWVLKKAALQHGSGTISVTGNVLKQDNNRFGLKAALNMKNVDAQKVWYEFENFGIPDISYKNIRGLLSASATVSLLLDKSGNFDMGTLNGEADFSVKQGALINFKPLQDIQTFAFKNRDFTDISFAEIKDRISFTKGTVTINRMEINSSVLSLFVEGVYGLSGNTDISIQLPLNNLKKRAVDYKPENLGAGRGGGMSIFLRAKTGDDGVVRIKYDPFKRFRKSPAADNKKN